MKRRSFLVGLAAVLAAPKSLLAKAPVKTITTVGRPGPAEICIQRDRKVPPGRIFAFDKKCVHAFELR